MAGFIGRNYGLPYGSYPGAPAQQMGGYQAPGYGWPNMQAPVQAQQMSKPTVHADIIQIEDEAAGMSEPVNAGTSQMMITKDESAILVKSVLANGETTMDIYRRMPQEAKKAEPEYITRAEFEQRMAAMVREPEEEEEPEERPEPVRRTAPKTTGGARKK